ncbi:hypothetical protein [Streptomyces sp. NPDC006333]|uniref:hypothetical protein n=1 Tax=Streptomyces sp. NPDC006333 TaxID=3156753 RepID=UPI0033AEB64E
MRRGICRVCGATDLDAVYLVQGSVKYPKQRSWYPERIHICRDCHGRGETPVDQWYVNHVRWTRVVGRGDLMPPTPCERCGLHFIRNGDPLLKRMTCSASCLTSLSDSRNASRGNKGSNQPCESCGEPITTGRADSRYCGSSCRQKAYRRRASNA